MVRVGGFDMDIITAVEMFKELDEGVGSVGPEKEDLMDKLQPNAGIIR